MGMEFAPTWLRRVSPAPPLLHMTTLVTEQTFSSVQFSSVNVIENYRQNLMFFFLVTHVPTFHRISRKFLE